jgi:hypothetical protein
MKNDAQIDYIPVEDLDFDYKNPRLAEEFTLGNTISSLEEMLSVLWEHNIDELIKSMLGNGYFVADPLLVDSSSSSKSYKVLEGNRRLAALKIINSFDLRNEYFTEEMNVLFQEAKDNAKLTTLQKIPCLKVNQDEALAMIGYKHITGAKVWSSYAKSYHIYNLHVNEGRSLKEIGKLLGDTYPKTKRLFRSIAFLEKAKSEKLFNQDQIESKRIYFSRLETALNYPTIAGKTFTFVDEDSTKEQKADVSIPPDNKQNVEVLMDALFGNKFKIRHQKPIVQSQGPDLPLLADVFQSDEAINELNETWRLDFALEKTTTDIDKCLTHLKDGIRSLELFNKHKDKLTDIDFLKEDLTDLITIARGIQKWQMSFDEEPGL